MNNFYHVYFCTSLSSETIKKIFNELDDWYRYSKFSWIVISDLQAKELRSKIKQLMTKYDQCLILKIDPSDFSGQMPANFWGWIKQKRTYKND